MNAPAILLGLVLGLPSIAFAGSDWLPEAAVARSAIDALPTVAAARQRGTEANARGEALKRDPYGLELSLMPLARHEQRNDRNSPELESVLAKRLRLPGKAALDGTLAGDGERVAQLALGDARHAGARQLLDLWMTWIRTAQLARLAEQQRTTLSEEYRAIARRVAVDDLPDLDAQRAAAVVAEAEVAVETARLAREQARLALTAHFPGLGLPAAAPVLPEPDMTIVGKDTLVSAILEHSHEVQLARAVAQRQHTTALRAEAERHPDPSIGLRVLSEANGNEQAVGVVLNLPFAAGSMRETARAEQALAGAMDTDAQAVEQRVRLEAQAQSDALPARVAAWQAAQRRVELSGRALERVAKAWRLGAVDFSDFTLAQRLLFDAKSSETALRAEVHAARARLDIDSHRLWGAEDGGAR